MGCPALALEVLSKLPEVEFEEDEEVTKAAAAAATPKVEPVPEPSNDIFSWGAIGENPQMDFLLTRKRHCC